MEQLMWEIVTAEIMMHWFVDLTWKIPFEIAASEHLGKTCYNSSVLYGAGNHSMAFILRIGYSYSKFSDVTGNGTVTKFWLSLLRETSISTHPS